MKVIFHSSLFKYTDVKSFDTDVTSPTQLISAIKILFPKLIAIVNDIHNKSLNHVLFFVTEDKKLLGDKHYLKDEFPKNSSIIYIVPTIFGSGRGVLPMILGAALIVAGFFTGGSTSLIGVSGVLTGSQLITMGVSFLLTGILELLKPNTTGAPPDTQERRNNDMFGSLENTNSPNSSIPLVYGMNRVAGQFITGYVKTVNHDKTTTIKVSEYV